MRALDELDKIDPNGYQLDSNSMRIERSDKGEVTSVIATGDVRFRWSDASGKCDSLAIDVRETTLVAKGTKRPATVQIPTGSSRVGQLDYNYRTKMFRVWKGLVLTKR